MLRGTFEQNNSRSRWFGFFLVFARFFKHGLPKLYSRCPEAPFADFFSQNHKNWHCERKNSAGFVTTAYYFPGNFWSKQFSKSSIWFFSSPCQIFQAWVTKTVFYVSRGTFCGIFFHRIILIGTVKEKIQLVSSELHSTFPGIFWAKKLLFFSPCQIFQAWVTKTVFYVSRGTFCGYFFHRIIRIGTVSEKIQLVLSKLHSIFPGNFWTKQFSKSSIWFFSSPCQIFQAWVTKTVFYVSRGTFCGIFFHRIILIGTVKEKIQLVSSELHSTFPGIFWAKQFLFFSPCQIVQVWVTKTVFYVSRGIFTELFSQNHINWHCERKNSAGFVKNAFYFCEELFEQNNSRSRRFGFFLVLARFFKHGGPKLFSTCPEALFADFFSANHINWHCERKNSAGFVKTAFYFSGELFSKTILEVVDLVFF